MGYPVTVFEKETEAGGLLRYGIGPHRLPRDILDYDLEYVRG
jgi:NADPH-dependent glutamate synthase beta subunit-like oxidoreductase